MSQQSRAPPPSPADPAPPAQLATLATLASAAKLLLETLGNRDFTAENHFALETLRRALGVSEPYIEILLRELEGHGIESADQPSPGRQDAERSSSKSRGLLQASLPKIVAIARELAKTRDARRNGSVRLTLLRELCGFLRVEVKAARKEVKRLEHVLEGKHTRRRHRRHRGDQVSGGGEGDGGGGEGGQAGKSRGSEGGDEGEGEGEGEDEQGHGTSSSPAKSSGDPWHADGRRSGELSKDRSSAHIVDQAPLIRTQSSSRHRAKGSSSRKGSIVPSTSSRCASNHSRKSVSRDVSNALPVSQVNTATLQVPSTQRAEGASSHAQSSRASLSSRHSSSRAGSVASRHPSSRHTVDEAPIERSQSRSTQRIKGVSKCAASRPSHHASNDARSVASRNSSSQHVVDEVPGIQIQRSSTERREKASSPSGSVRHASKDSKSDSSKASSSQHSRVTRAPTVSTISVESQAPSSTVANVGVGDSKAHASRSSNNAQASKHAVQDGSVHDRSSASHRSKSDAQVSSPVPFERPATVSASNKSSNTSSRVSERAKPDYRFKISQLNDGGWKFQQLPIKNAEVSPESKRSQEAAET
ncbi:hypothetical protein CERZMDRAFT_97648 [Cercospora zeae-maydis SCOH1-5]|uniref:Uncharacterized protein n=1 Tax=Cercospora zeae-maydis SCOH1-5 TaxID=717836 RepID=A0A6A6FG29_9PEZI|nr:hypothetical protein CERZMDRAFT_97648 [Cercospora zeae-maydis SCOH1-5]